MDNLLLFLAKYTDQLMTILSIVIGGIITYFSTSAAEKRKEKRQFRREKIEQVLIPYCTCIEQTIPEIKKIYDFPYSIINKELFDIWMAQTKTPLSYLNAEKRVYLSKRLRKDLEQYKLQVNLFYETLDNDYLRFRQGYYLCMKNIIMHFPDAPSAMDIHISFKDSAELKIKRAILSQDDISLKDEITEICYIINDDFDNTKHSIIYIKDEYRDTWGLIHYGFGDENDVTDPMEQRTIDFLDYISENIDVEKKIIIKILAKMKSNTVLIELREHLDEMRKILINEFDSITK